MKPPWWLPHLVSYATMTALLGVCLCVHLFQRILHIYMNTAHALSRCRLHSHAVDPVTQLSPNETFHKPEDHRQAAAPDNTHPHPLIPPFLKGGEGEKDTEDEGCKEEDDGERKG